MTGWVPVLIGLIATISAIYFGIGPRKHRNVGLFMLSMFVLSIASVIGNRLNTEEKIGEQLYGDVDEAIPSEKTPYYSVITQTCIFGEPDETSDCRLSLTEGMVLYAYGVKDGKWIRARTVVAPDSSEPQLEEIGWVDMELVTPAPYPSEIYFSSIQKQIISKEDLYLNFLEIGIGVVVIQLFRRRKKVLGTVIGLPFAGITLWHGLVLYGKILDYRIKDVEFSSWSMFYPLLILLGILLSNAAVNYLTDWLSGETQLVLTARKKRFAAFILGNLVLFIISTILVWVGRNYFQLPILMLPYSQEALSYSMVDFENNPAGAAILVGGLIYIGWLAWQEGILMKESPENILKRMGLYIVFSFMSHLPFYLAVDLIGIHSISVQILTNLYWVSLIFLWTWLGWDIVFTFIGKPDYMRSPVPLWGLKRHCMKCEQLVGFERNKITGHAADCPWTPDPTADSLFKKCLELIEQKKWDTAANVLRAATESHPNYIKFAAYYGKALMETGDIDLALEVLSSRIERDPMPEYYSILTSGLILKAQSDEKFKEALLVEAKEALVLNKANLSAQRILSELQPEETKPAQKSSRVRRWFLGEENKAAEARVLEGIRPLLTGQEEVLLIIVQVPLAGLAPDGFVLTNTRYILYRPGAFRQMSFRDYRWQQLQDAHLSEGIFWSTLWFRSKDKRKLSLGMLPKEQARAVYRIAQEKEELFSSQNPIDHQ